MTQRFREDLDEVLRLITESDSLALSRYADGEASILKNITVGNKDGWLYKKDKNLIFRHDLRYSLLRADKNYLYGLSCTCCDKSNHDFLLNAVRAPLEQLTFSNLWVNANFPVFQEQFLPALCASRKLVFICTGSKARVSDLEAKIHVSGFIPIHGNCVEYWEKHREHVRGLMDLHASQHNGAIFLFAAGPLSEILIHEMWQANQNNIYLDIGSTLDPLLFRRQSRTYHIAGRELAQRVCAW